MNTAPLRIEFICPPIPIRSFDYCAYEDGDEESGRYGYGATAEEAAIDWMERYGDEDAELEGGA